MGIEGSYKITLKSQLGPKSGFFSFKQFEKKLFVTFTFLGHENILTGKEKAGKFEINGKIMTPLGLRECKVGGTLICSIIDAEIMIDGKTYPMTGMKSDNNLKGESE